MKTLLLWDIDGTLLTSGGAGMRALHVALRDAFALEHSLEDMDFAGRTDRWIMRQIFGRIGHEHSEANFDRLSAAYFAALPAELDRATVRVLPGVRQLLTEAAAHPGVIQGLLTGNLRRGAEIKLSHQNLWHYFAFGGFADDAELRNEIAPHAARRARETLDAVTTLADERVLVIGDTPHDIACGQAIGARTLGVATGRHTVEELRACNPTAVMPDLANTERFWEIAFGK